MRVKFVCVCVSDGGTVDKEVGWLFGSEDDRCKVAGGLGRCEWCW